MGSQRAAWAYTWRIARSTVVAEPRRSILTLIPIGPLAFGIAVLSSAEVLGRATDIGPFQLLSLAVVAGLTIALSLAGGFWQAATAQMRLAEVASIQVDSQLIATIAGSPTLELLERGDVVDRLELLRSSRQTAASALASLNAVAGTIVFFMATLILLVAVDVRLSLIALSAAGPAWLTFRSQRRIDATETDVTELRREALHLYDIATGSRGGKEIRIFGTQATLGQRYRSASSEIHKALLRSEGHAAFQRLLGWTIFFLLTLGILLWLLASPPAAGLNRTDLFITFLALTQAAVLARTSTSTLVALQATLSTAAHFAFVVGEAEKYASTRGVPRLGPDVEPSEGLELREVTFRYRGASEPALSNVSLRIPKGSTLALVGENGAGKTTLVKLLCGLYRPTSGDILLNGRSISGMEPAEWFGQITAVFQDFVRYELLVREAVGLGRVDLIDNDSALATAVGRADAQEVLDRSSLSWDSQLGGRFGGADLSGGQWQRIAVARGMMRDAAIVFTLDEPTGFLDPPSEERLFRKCVGHAHSLSSTVAGCLVWVSHRYSTVKDADQIAFLENGHLAELGCHADLMAAGRGYASLYRNQERAYR